jgi:hypothetical protein
MHNSSCNIISKKISIFQKTFLKIWVRQNGLMPKICNLYFKYDLNGLIFNIGPYVEIYKAIFFSQKLDLVEDNLSMNN